jgi:hypothetical protein
VSKPPLNFDKAHRKVEELLDTEDEAVDLITLMLIADGAHVDGGPTPAQAQAELRKRGLL